MTEYSDFSLLALARVVKSMHHRRDAFLDTVRRTLYLTFKEDVFKNGPPPAADGSPRTTALKTIAELAYRDQDSKDGRHIPVVFTTNFDNVLELELKKAKVGARPVYNAKRRKGNKLPVVHVHGYLPKDGRVPPLDLVFTEDEYHRLSYSAFHWSLTDIVNCFRNYTVLFVGLSMSDPNLRRLLDATHVNGDGIVHYQLRKEPGLTGPERQKAVKFVDDYARELGLRDGFPEVKAEADVSSAIDNMLREAKAYHERLFRNMGVGTVWYKSHDDVPKILTEIAG
jgi:SIR2-like domain